MNQEQTATDAITGDTVDVTPIPGNATAALTFGFGDRQGLVAFDGTVIALFSSNLNGGTSEITTADVSIPSGPTVVTGDMGPVVNDFTYTPTVYADSTYTGTRYLVGATYAPITYNNVFATAADAPAAVGTRGLYSFVVTFDRPIDISTFTPSQIQVMYESPSGGPMKLIAVASIQPLDNLTSFGPAGVGLGVMATQFLITLVAPQFAVGTYSYAIGLNTGGTPVASDALLSDDIRSVATGTLGSTNNGPSGATATVSGTGGHADPARHLHEPEPERPHERESDPGRQHDHVDRVHEHQHPRPSATVRRSPTRSPSPTPTSRSRRTSTIPSNSAWTSGPRRP